MALKTLSEDDFKSTILTSKLPFLVVFKTDWNVQAKALTATLESIESDYSGKVIFYTVDTDENPGLVEELAITILPLTLIFANGRQNASLAGNVSKEALIAALAPFA